MMASWAEVKPLSMSFWTTESIRSRALASRPTEARAPASSVLSTTVGLAMATRVLVLAVSLMLGMVTWMLLRPLRATPEISMEKMPVWPTRLELSTSTPLTKMRMPPSTVSSLPSQSHRVPWPS